MAGDIKTDLIKEELQGRIAKYETWIDGARRFLKYANDDLENPNYSKFEKDRAKAGISAREPKLREWEKDVEIFKLALAQLEEQDRRCRNCGNARQIPGFPEVRLCEKIGHNLVLNGEKCETVVLTINCCREWIVE